MSIRSAQPLNGIPPRRVSPRGAWHLTSTHSRITRKLGALRLSWPRIGTFRIEPQRRRLVYRLVPNASQDAFLDVLLGPVVSFLSIADGRTPLHGCAVRVGQQAACFLGQPGAGKSTMAAALLLAGHGLLVDDLMALTWRQGRPHVLPGYPEIRLWPASGQRLLADAFAQLPRVVPTASKRRVDPRRYPGGFVSQATPIRVIYELRRSSTMTTPRIDALEPKEVFLALARNLYNADLMTPDVLSRQFEELGRLTQTVPLRRVLIPRAECPPQALVDLVLDNLAHAPGGEERHARPLRPGFSGSFRPLHRIRSGHPAHPLLRSGRDFGGQDTAMRNSARLTQSRLIEVSCHRNFQLLSSPGHSMGLRTHGQGRGSLVHFLTGG